MQFIAKKGLWKSGNFTIDPKTMEATSYDTVIMKRVGTYLVVNMHPFSRTTGVHQQKLRDWLEYEHDLVPPGGYTVIMCSVCLSRGDWLFDAIRYAMNEEEKAEETYKTIVNQLTKNGASQRLIQESTEKTRIVLRYWTTQRELLQSIGDRRPLRVV